MELKLWSSFAKRKDSTKRPSAPPDYIANVELKEETSYTNPKITFSSQNYPQYTYAYITPLDRYYFVRSTNQRNRNFYEMELECDALATAKDGIGNYNCYIERCADANFYNTDILDSALTVEDVVEHTAEASTNIFFGVSSYIVRMIGRGSTGIQTFGIGTSPSYLSGVFNPIFDNPSTLTIDDFLTAYVEDPSKYVIGLYLTPFNPQALIGQSGVKIYCGWFDTGLTAKALSNNAIYNDTKTLAKPNSIYSDFRKTDNAFSHYTLFLPGIGTVPLSADIMDSVLTLEVNCDQHTGDIIYQLKADGALVSSYNGNCYASLQIGNGDASNGGNIIKTTGDLIGDVASGNALNSAKDVIQGIRNVISPTPSFIGSLTGIAGVAFKDAVISVLQKSSGEFPTTQAGRPCCKNLTIGRLSGYIRCGNPSIELAIESDLLDTINNYLANGFYYE